MFLIPQKTIFRAEGTLSKNEIASCGKEKMDMQEETRRQIALFRYGLTAPLLRKTEKGSPSDLGSIGQARIRDAKR